MHVSWIRSNGTNKNMDRLENDGPWEVAVEAATVTQRWWSNQRQKNTERERESNVEKNPIWLIHFGVDFVRWVRVCACVLSAPTTPRIVFFMFNILIHALWFHSVIWPVTWFHNSRAIISTATIHRFRSKNSMTNTVPCTLYTHIDAYMYAHSAHTHVCLRIWYREQYAQNYTQKITLFRSFLTHTHTRTSMVEYRV